MRSLFESSGFKKAAHVISRPRKEAKELSISAEIWTPLNLSGSQIRLLRLEPCQNVHEQPICSLEIVSLEDSPQYEALSYAWGNPRVRKPITLNGAQWRVTESLHAALRYLRDRRVETILWVDALCIDQGNLEERSGQVQLMKKIYSNAMRVRVWLGLSIEGTSEAMFVLQQIGRGLRGREITINGAPFDKSHLQYLNELLERSWWSRLWTLQEMILARTITIHCGPRSINADRILGTEGLVRDNFFLGFDTEAADVDGLMVRRFMHNLNVLHGCNDLRRWFEQQSSSAFPLILSKGPFYKSFDPRDSIYGFLGLTNADIAGKIVPDYSVPLSQTYINAAIELTRSMGSLRMFSFTQLVDKTSRVVPTWVPAWRKTRSSREKWVWLNQTLRSTYVRLYDASKGHQLEFEVMDQSSLRIRGILLARITKIDCEFIFENALDKQETLDRVDGIARLFGLAGRFGRLDVAIESPFWRILTNDVRSNRKTLDLRRCQDKDWSAFREWATEPRYEQETREAGDLFFDTRSSWEYRRPFTTKEGLIGVGPAELRINDCIYIIAGGQVPFVLRPSSSVSNINTFELVGDCYVHGVMDGEAVDENPPPESRFPKPQWRDVFLE